MTEVARIIPVPPAPTPPAPKRVSANAATIAVAAPEAVQPAAKSEAPRPIEPVVLVEPSTRLTITKDEAANAFVYRSISAETGEVLWQYPVEQVLRMAHRLRELEGLDGHQLDEKI
jgi:hypothetical protein